jgi:Na+/H+ antiporter NhaD/arsenite permease-like protein
MIQLAALTCLLLLPSSAAFGGHMDTTGASLTTHWAGFLSLATFIVALLLATLEEFTQLRKSKPMLVSAGIIWALIAIASAQTGTSHLAEEGVRHNLLQYAELMLLMLVVMTYINAMSERRVFHALRGWIGHRGYSYRRLFWLIGIATFLLSPLLDNLSTALLMGAVAIKVGEGNPRFIGLACTIVVIASNAGGAFSPFGDITTLMVWQQNIQSSNGTVDFWSFLRLLPPAAVNFLLPASIMHFAVPDGYLHGGEESTQMLRGARRIMLLFIAAIATAVLFQGLLNLPAVIGMLTGLSYLQFFGFYLKVTHREGETGLEDEEGLAMPVPFDTRSPYDIFVRIARAEWDTLLFLYGVALSVGGLGYIGYLALASDVMYTQWGATYANIGVGLVSALLENIPTMYAVLTMAPEMSLEQWLLVTLTTGIGGSLLAIGSAAGVALMGQSQGCYTFFTHLRWAPVVLLGYFTSILVHLWMTGSLS